MLSLLRLEHKPNNLSNHFLICIFLFLSYSFGIETIYTSYTCVVPSKTKPNSRPKWVKCLPIFRPKRLKPHTRWAGTYLYSLYKGVPPPLPPMINNQEKQYACHDLSVWNKWWKSHLLFPSEHNKKPEKTFIRTGSIFGGGLSRVLPTDPLFTQGEPGYWKQPLWFHINRYKIEIVNNYTTLE